MQDNISKTVKLLENFMSELEVEGICGFWIDEEPDDHNIFWVYIILDLDWLEDNQHPSKPGFVSGRMRNGIKEEIKKFLGLNVMVGSVARRCPE